MAIRSRKVKNKRSESGERTRKRGTVYDVFINLKTDTGYNMYCKRGFLIRSDAIAHEHVVLENSINPLKRKSNQLLSDYLTTWLNHGIETNRWSRNTAVGYKNNIHRHIIPVIGHHRLRDITPEHCDNVMRRMKFNCYTDSAIHYVRQTFSVAFNDACSYSLIDRNPVMYTITKFKASDFKPQLYDINIIARLMNDLFGTDWECFILLTGLYGLRRSEALGLKWGCIDFNRRSIVIREQLSPRELRRKGQMACQLKTVNSLRTLYLTDLALEIFLRQLARLHQLKSLTNNTTPFVDQDYVICQINGRPCEETHMAKKFHILTDRLGYPRCRIHDLRHSTASNIYDLTGDYLAVSRILGHTIKGLENTLGSSKLYESMTSLYIHVQPSRTAEAVKIYHNEVKKLQDTLKQRKVVNLSNLM